jgi:hypothetical protein
MFQSSLVIEIYSFFSGGGSPISANTNNNAIQIAREWFKADPEAVVKPGNANRWGAKSV